MSDFPPRTIEAELTGSPSSARLGSTADRPIGQTDVLNLLEETAEFSKRQVVTATVRVSTQTETYEEVGEVSLDRSVVEVTHIPVGQIVEDVPVVRTVGDTTIIPVLEERYRLVKMLYLKEEIHIRHHTETEVVCSTVQLRRQKAVVERTDVDERTMPDLPDMKSSRFGEK